MAIIHRIGTPENDGDARAIKRLAKGLPDDCFVFHNFEVTTGRGLPYEYDVAVPTSSSRSWTGPTARASWATRPAPPRSSGGCARRGGPTGTRPWRRRWTTWPSVKRERAKRLPRPSLTVPG